MSVWPRNFIGKFIVVYVTSYMFRLFTEDNIRLNRFKNVRSQGVMCDIRLPLPIYGFVMAQPDDACSKKP